VARIDTTNCSKSRCFARSTGSHHSVCSNVLRGTRIFSVTLATQYAAASTHHMGVYPQDASYLLGPLTREPYQRRHIDSLQHNLDSQFAQPFPKYPQLVNEQAVSHTHPSEISRQGSHKAECVFLSRTTGSDVLELLVRKYCFDLRRSLSWTSY